MDNTTHLEIDVCNSLKTRQAAMSVLNDWSDACRNVVHDKLIGLLINLGFPCSFIRFMKSFLSDRSFYVQVNEYRGETSTNTRGLLKQQL